MTKKWSFVVWYCNVEDKFKVYHDSNEEILRREKLIGLKDSWDAKEKPINLQMSKCLMHQYIFVVVLYECQNVYNTPIQVYYYV